MSKISISDIIELAKAGYKPADVKELFELAETAEAKKDTPPAPNVPPATEKQENGTGNEIDPFERLAKQGD